jgi:hypothetical protein
VHNGCSSGLHASAASFHNPSMTLLKTSKLAGIVV